MASPGAVPANVAARPVPPTGPMRLESDLRIAFLVLNHARYRVMQDVFGLPRDQVNLASLVLLGMAGGTASARVRRMLSGPALPGPNDTMFGIAAVREVVQSIAGPASRDASMFGTLVAIAAAGGVVIPVARRSVRAVEHGSHRLERAFMHRYGVHVATVKRAARGITPDRTG